MGDVEALAEVLWPGKYDDNRARVWDWCGCVAPATVHFAGDFCPLLHLLAHVAAARAEEREAALAEAAALAIGCEHSASLGWCDICGEWHAALTALLGGGA